MTRCKPFFFSPRRLALLPALLLLAAAIGGCAGQSRYPTPSPPMTPTQQYTEPEQRYNNPGSLYSAAETPDLYADNRAHRVGDIILIKIVETSKSKTKADTTTNKESTNNLQVTAAFGERTAGLLLPGMGGPLSGKVGVDPILASRTVSELSASGETKRENYVTATIGARVLQVLPGGVLQVAGFREVRVNYDTQYMVISGLVRSKDVAPDNSVESTQLADSKIEYFGEGDLANKQRQGWLTRLLDNVWPF